MLLGDKVAVISGAASPRGIGLATAKLFAQHWARVAIFDLVEACAKRSAEELGSQHHDLGCDATNLESWKRAAQQTLEAFGKVDVLLANVGITQLLKFMDISPENWDKVLDVNLRGVFYLSQAFVP